MTSDVTVNGIAALRGDICEPFRGPWLAEVELLSEGVDQPLVGSVVLQILGEEFRGAIVADPTDSEKRMSGVSGGFVMARIVAGAGGLETPLAPFEWSQGAVVQQVLTNILGAGGEIQSPEIAPDILARALPQWSYVQGTVRSALDSLCEYLGVTWRIRRDGLVWIGVPEPTPAPAPDYIIIDAAPETATVGWSLNEMSVQVDDIIDGLTIRKLLWVFDSDSLRAVVTYAPGPAAALFELITIWSKRMSLDYLRAVPGRISTQNGDGTVQLQPDDSRVSPLKRVGIRLGLPDSEIQVNPSSRAVATWENGAPAGPVLQSFGQSTATKIRIGVSQNPQPTILGTLFRTKQAQMDSDAASACINSAISFVAAGTAFTSIADPMQAADFNAARPFFVALAAAMNGLALTTGAAPGGLAKAFLDFEAAAAVPANNNYLTRILEAG